MIAISDACICAHPMDTGRAYYGASVCVRCGRFIVGSRHVARLRVEAEAWRIKAFREARVKAKGGLHPDGTTKYSSRERGLRYRAKKRREQ